MKDINSKPLIGRKRIGWLDNETQLTEQLLKNLGIKKIAEHGNIIWLAEETQEIVKIDKYTVYDPKGYLYILHLNSGEVILEWENR